MTDDGERCECGAPADPRLHPPLPKPPPLRSWHAMRNAGDRRLATNSRNTPHARPSRWAPVERI